MSVEQTLAEARRQIYGQYKSSLPSGSKREMKRRDTVLGVLESIPGSEWTSLQLQRATGVGRREMGMCLKSITKDGHVGSYGRGNGRRYHIEEDDI